MMIENETDRPALKLTHCVNNRERRWVIIFPGEGASYNYPEYGNAGNWYGDVNDAEEFDSIEEATAHLVDYGYNAVVAFVEIETTIHYTPNKD